MRIFFLLMAAVLLSGCATTVYTPAGRTTVAVTEVVHVVPVAAGVYTSSVIYGGPVVYVPHPTYHVRSAVNYDVRFIYNNARRNVYYKAQPPYHHPPQHRRYRR